MTADPKHRYWETDPRSNIKNMEISIDHMNLKLEALKMFGIALYSHPNYRFFKEIERDLESFYNLKRTELEREIQKWQ
jgi:hypothetical protein